MNQDAMLRRCFSVLAASPVSFAFAASFLLSAIAVATGNLNRDGMLYTAAARAFIEGGLPAAIGVFSWPFLAVLMGALSQATGLPPEWCGHALNLLFMSGACALMIALIRDKDPELAWLSVAILLALPGLNGYRNELIREYGSWFFVMLAFWLAKDWPENPSWRRSLAIHSAIILATLFRPEALIFVPCILLWQHFQPSPSSRPKRALMLCSLPAIGLAAVLMLHFSGMLPASSRIASEISRFDFSHFDRTAQEMAKAFHPYARDEARTGPAILFFGSLALIPWKLLGKFGVFLLPLWFFVSSPQRHEVLRRYGLLISAMIGYLLVLAVFVLRLQLVSGRYLGPVVLFSIPFVAFGLKRLLDRHPRWRMAALAICGVLALSNVLSLTPRKTHFAEAGHWLSTQLTEDPRVYLESARAAHYAGLSFATRTTPPSRTQLLDDIRANRYDVVVLEVSRKEDGFAEWLAKAGLKEIRRFSDTNGDAIVVTVPRDQAGVPKAESITASSLPATTSKE